MGRVRTQSPLPPPSPLLPRRAKRSTWKLTWLTKHELLNETATNCFSYNLSLYPALHSVENIPEVERACKWMSISKLRSCCWFICRDPLIQYRYTILTITRKIWAEQLPNTDNAFSGIITSKGLYTGLVYRY